MEIDRLQKRRAYRKLRRRWYYFNRIKLTEKFTADGEVVMDGIEHEIYCGYESGSRGNYGIKCREK